MRAPVPTFPGELISTTRLLGNLFNPKGSDAGPLFALNGNKGGLYIFTADGLFVGEPFTDGRLAERCRSPQAVRNMSRDNGSLGEENFWPMITGTKDGQVYLVDGSFSCIVRIEGLETIRRIPPIKVTVTAKNLENALNYATTVETQRILEQGSGMMKVPLAVSPPRMDGTLVDWPGAWVEIDYSA
jgi:hypothetical protein